MQVQNYIAFDIETVPLDWDGFAESQQEYILRRAETPEEIEKRKNEMGLTPFTAKVVCVGLQYMSRNEEGRYELAKRVAYALDESLDDETVRSEELPTGDACIFCSERRMLADFWKLLVKYPDGHLISFNGRNFDAPFLMLRSALLRVRPSRNLMAGTKFNYSLHTDLIDELSFFASGFSYGATKRFNFDFYARAFGIESPKGGGIDGSKVPEFFADGRVAEIAEYCLRDVDATWKLFEIWREYLVF